VNYVKVNGQDLDTRLEEIINDKIYSLQEQIMLIEGIISTFITKKDKNVVLCVVTKNELPTTKYCGEQRWMVVQEVDDEQANGQKEMEMGYAIVPRASASGIKDYPL
jgi:hypothetical protein